jgi:hypothetical protein
MSRSRLLIIVTVLVLQLGCTATPSPTATAAPTATQPEPTATPGPTATPAESQSPTATPEPTFSLALPEVTDPRVIIAAAAPTIDAAGGTLTVTVTSASEERIDELVLRWRTELNGSLRLAPFTPTEERISDGGPPLVQEWTKWVIGPGEQGEPEGTTSVGWGPLMPGATLTIPLIATRLAAEPISFDLQFLAGNDLLTTDSGEPAELRVEVP